MNAGMPLRLAAAVAVALVATMPPVAAASSAPGASLHEGERAPSGDPAAHGDPANGERIHARCQACHSLARDRTGPRHCDLFGRRAGSVAGFDYSAAMRHSGIVWNATTLERFLADPLGTVPGTTMGYAGVTDARERADLIAFLRRAKCG